MCLCGLCNDDPEGTQDITLNSQTDPRKLQDSVCKSATLIINHRSVITSNSWFTITHTHTDQCERVMHVQQHNRMPLMLYCLIVCSNQPSLITSFPSEAPLKFQPCAFISLARLFSNNPDRSFDAAASSGSLRWKIPLSFRLPTQWPQRDTRRWILSKTSLQLPCWLLLDLLRCRQVKTFQ